MELTALGNYCDITSAKRIYAEEYVEEGIPFYRGKEIIEKSKDQTISEPLFISEGRYNELTTKFGAPEAGDILLTSVGTLGIPYVVQEEDKFYFKDGNLTWLRKFSNELNSKYLYYWLTSDFGKEPLLARAIGSSQGAITIDILKKYKIYVPDKKIQDSIVEVLSQYDNLIRLNNKRIKLLEQTAEEIYKEWFVRFRYPGYETAEFENGVPKGWKSISLKELLLDDFNGGWGEDVATDKYINEGAVIRGTDIPDVYDGNYKDVPIRYHTDNHINNKQLLENDIVIELSNGNIDNIGRTLLIDKSLLSHFDKVMCASFCKTLRFKDNRVAFYTNNLLRYMQKYGLLNYYKNTGTNGINNFNYKRFLKMNILIPNDLSLLKELELFSQEIIKLRESNFFLKQQRDFLLPCLMSGKLEV